MRSRNLTPYLLLCLFVMLSQFSFAALPNKALINKDGINAVDIETNTTAVPTKALTKKQIRKQSKKAKRQAKFQKRIAKIKKKLAAVDFNDPVRKWLWFGLAALAAAIAIGILNILISTTLLYKIAAFLGAVGVILLIVWAVKEFA